MAERTHAGPPPAAGRTRAANKGERHARILALIAERRVGTQDDLAAALEREGFNVTQATVSRDIRELGLVKVPVAEGGARYAPPGAPAPGAAISERMLRLFRECVVGVDWTDSLVVLATLPATAAGVAEAVDGLGAPEVIGTLSGERTVFVAVKPKSAVPSFVRRLRALLQPETGTDRAERPRPGG
jgi:transcriptional regulator of arginine metabolism